MLLVISLLGTLWLVKQVVYQPTKLASKPTDQESLPGYITKDVIIEIYKKFESAFNSQDHDIFWNLFSDLARTQMNKNQTNMAYDGMIDRFGKVKNGTFSHYEFLVRKGNMKTFLLHYLIALEESKYGNKGTLDITITDNGKVYGILGINLNF